MLIRGSAREVLESQLFGQAFAEGHFSANDCAERIFHFDLCKAICGTYAGFLGRHPDFESVQISFLCFDPVSQEIWTERGLQRPTMTLTSLSTILRYNRLKANAKGLRKEYFENIENIAFGWFSTTGRLPEVAQSDNGAPGACSQGMASVAKRISYQSCCCDCLWLLRVKRKPTFIATSMTFF